MRIFRNYLKEGVNPYSQSYDIEGIDVICYKQLKQSNNVLTTPTIEVNDMLIIRSIHPFDNLTYYIYLKSYKANHYNPYYFTDDDNFGDYFISMAEFRSERLKRLLK